MKERTTETGGSPHLGGDSPLHSAETTQHTPPWRGGEEREGGEEERKENKINEEETA